MLVTEFFEKKNRNAQKQLNKFCHQSFKEEARLHSFPKKYIQIKGTAGTHVSKSNSMTLE